MTRQPLAERKYFLCHHKAAWLTSACCANDGSEGRGETRASDLQLRQKGKSGVRAPSQPFSVPVSWKQHPAVRQEKERRSGGLGMECLWPVPALSGGMKPEKGTQGQVFPVGGGGRVSGGRKCIYLQLPRTLCLTEPLVLAPA